MNVGELQRKLSSASNGDLTIAWGISNALLRSGLVGPTLVNQANTGSAARIDVETRRSLRPTWRKHLESLRRSFNNTTFRPNGRAASPHHRV